MDPMDSQSSLPTAATTQPKRSRILLSCGPCRASKLKCNREAPCSQCTKKAREDLCVYAPKPTKTKRRAARGDMSARLKRLEGMVRGMMDEDDEDAGDGVPGGKRNDDADTVGNLGGHVIKGENATTYVGATHCMAMLEDVGLGCCVRQRRDYELIQGQIEDLKCYFDVPEEEENEGSPEDIEAPEMLILQRGSPLNKDDLLCQIPDRNIADRLMSRYFASMSPSQHVMHRPAFTRQYARFWNDPSSVDLHWLAQLFMMLCLGVFYNSHIAPHELEGDSPMPMMDRVRHYKSCAGWALVLGKYTQPTPATLPAFMLFVETNFLFNRAAQMNCYLLSAVNIRILLKMGLHRDPSKLANISVFEGEMRRRIWNMATQLETLVSFHMGLPSMLPSIDSDTEVPRNLQDEDFDEGFTELPPSRPNTEHTHMMYPIHKTHLMRAFGNIARQAHSLTPTAYPDTLKLDKALQAAWEGLPSFARVRPLDECIGDSPTLLMQRFGLAALYNKGRIVLHRPYLAEPAPKSERDYSRQQCFQAATTLLRNQSIIYEACKVGNLMSQHAWFVSSLSVHDYLSAATVIYIIIQNENYAANGPGWDWTHPDIKKPSKEELINMLRRSWMIWSDISSDTIELRKTAHTLAAMLARLGCPVDQSPSAGAGPTESSPVDPSVTSTNSSSVMPHSSVSNTGTGSDLFSTNGFSGVPTGAGSVNTAFTSAAPPDGLDSMTFPSFDIPLGQIQAQTQAQSQTTFDFDPSWAASGNIDWRLFDISLAHSHTAGTDMAETGPIWTERVPIEEMDFMASGWGQGAGNGGMSG